MKLVSFSVTNYRSITNAHKVELGQRTVLLGKNNEGKSNISNALNCAMNILIAHSSNREFFLSKRLYDWERDFPIQLQSRKQNVRSIFRLQFKLDENEINEFYSNIGSRLNGKLTIEITIGKNGHPKINVPKRGKNTTLLVSKSDKIAYFISKRISINYISAIRTENDILDEIEKSVNNHLKVLEENTEYQNAINTINKLEQKILDNISASIQEPLQEFMPKITNVKIMGDRRIRSRYFSRNINIIIDDGNPTNIKLKGEGVKSLTAMALLKEQALKSATPLIIIEEPESHLHPEAINQLHSIIESLSEHNQVIVTTHNPLFVVRDNISSNIIVGNGIAKPAENLKEIRDVLGVNISDNLINAEYVLVVEGCNDKELLEYVLPKMSNNIANAIKQNLFIVYDLGGASNLSFHLNLLKNMLCTYMVLLDHDEEGKKNRDRAEKENLLERKDVAFTSCKGMKESEFEDCLNPKIYQEKIKEKYNCDLSKSSEFRNNKSKWSNRLSEAFHEQGKYWDDDTEKEIKKLVVEEIKNQEDLDIVFIKEKSGFLRKLVDDIENIIKK